MGILIINSKKYGPKEVLYDDQDHQVVSMYKWHLSKGKNTFYVCGYAGKISHRKYKQIKLHRLLVDAPLIDHKNGNGLDNRRDNLRPVTIEQNVWNSAKPKHNVSGYKGVGYKPSHNAYRVRLTVRKKLVYCRYFKSIEQAVRAYNEAAIKYHGEFARLNPI